MIRLPVAVPAAVYVLFAVFAFSFYPVIMILGAAQTGPVTFVFLSQFFATLAGLFWLLIFLKRREGGADALAGALRTLSWEHCLYALLVGLCCVVTNIFFIFSTMMMARAGAAVIYDTWPFFAMLLTPLVVRKAWFPIRGRHYGMASLSLIGIFLIVLSDQWHLLGTQNAWTEEMDLIAVAGAILAFMGSVTLAVFYVMRIQISHYISQHFTFLKNRTAEQSALGEFIARLAGIPFAILFMFLFPEDESTVSLQGLFWAALLGVGVLFAGNWAYVVGFLKSRSPTLHMLWYLVPVLAVFWLWAFGLTPITALIVAGSALIIVSNILLQIDRKQDKRNTTTR